MVKRVVLPEAYGFEIPAWAEDGASPATPSAGGRRVPPADWDGLSPCCANCPSTRSVWCCRATPRTLARTFEDDLDAEGFTQGAARRSFIRLLIRRLFR